MSVMSMPKKQKELRVEPAHRVKPSQGKNSAKIERAVAEAAAESAAVVRAEEGEENCPVIRANHIVFSSGRTGRTRVLFY